MVGLLRLLVLLLLLSAASAAAARSFVVSGDDFERDGAPFRVISGAFHYFRTPPALWRDRLERMRLAGLNTVETYVPWNLHEPAQGTFDFSGPLDVAAFLRAVADAGLLAIVRPPPYICAEWEWGGLPSWLPQTQQCACVRCTDAAFLAHTDAFLKRLGAEIAQLQYARGGPVVAVQVENEYGSYGSDKAYLQHLEDTLRGVFDSAVLFSSNGAGDEQLKNGATDTVLRTVNFGAGTDVAAALKTLRKYQPHGPLFCTELWEGWFDHWGEKHHTVSPAAAATTLNALLERNASANIYMFVGGTNFAFMAGANEGSDFAEADVTSYDYDAPIAEDGDCGDKWKALKETIAKYTTVPSGTPSANKKEAYGKVTLTPVGDVLNASFLAQIDKPIQASSPLSFVNLKQAYGFVLYETTVHGPVSGARLSIPKLRDRAIVFVDGEFAGILTTKNASSGSLTVACSKDKFSLQLLVENLGRINFGASMAEQDKGIIGEVQLNGAALQTWTHWSLSLASTPAPPSTAAFSPGVRHPVFFHGAFSIAGQPADTFLDMQGHAKGVAFVNGHNLGRFWELGPQRTLYVPAPFLKQGTNSVDIFDLDASPSAAAFASFVASPLL